MHKSPQGTGSHRYTGSVTDSPGPGPLKPLDFRLLKKAKKKKNYIQYRLLKKIIQKSYKTHPGCVLYRVSSVLG